MFYLDCPCISDKMQNHLTRYLNTNYPSPVLESGAYVEKGDPIFGWAISEPQLNNWDSIKAKFSAPPRYQFQLPSPISGTFYRGEDRSESFWGYSSSGEMPRAFSILTDEKPRQFTTFEVYQTFFDFFGKHGQDIDSWLDRLDGWKTEKDRYWGFVSSEQEKARTTFCSVRSA